MGLIVNKILYSQWGGNPPQILTISQPAPEAPYIPLTGGETTRMSLDSYIRDLKNDFQKQCGEYFAYAWGYYGSGDEADTYTLQTWQICPPNDGTYEAVVILYYSPLNPYLTIKKHFGEDSAQEYLSRNAAIVALTEALV